MTVWEVYIDHTVIGKISTDKSPAVNDRVVGYRQAYRILEVLYEYYQVKVVEGGRRTIPSPGVGSNEYRMDEV